MGYNEIRSLMAFNPKEPYTALKDLPPDFDFETLKILKALKEARSEIGELKGYCSNIPNPMMLMSVAVAKESVESSKIEEIHTTVENVLEGQVLPESEIKGPDKEVLRYREAILFGYKSFKDVGLVTRTITGIHDKLLPDSQGYRKQQNSITNDRTGEKIYTPPLATTVERYISQWENFVNSEDKGNLDPLIRCALGHYQFEAIHPFGDGNGRTGRILLALQLVSEKLLDHPVLYISGYLNKNRTEYYKRLLEVTKNEEWEELVLFMLNGFATQAAKTKNKLFQMQSEYQKIIELIKTKHSKMNAIETANHLFSLPVTNPTYFAKALNIHYQTASKHLNELKESGILKDTKMGKNHFYYVIPLFKMLN